MSDVGFDKDEVRTRHLGADEDFDVINSLGKFVDRQGMVELNFGGDQDFIGAEVLGAEVDDALCCLMRNDCLMN